MSNDHTNDSGQPDALPPLPGGGSWRWDGQQWVPAHPDKSPALKPVPQLGKE